MPDENIAAFDLLKRYVIVDDRPTSGHRDIVVNQRHLLHPLVAVESAIGVENATPLRGGGG